MRRLAVLGVLATLAAGAQAQFIEDFEHGNTGLYTQTAGANNFTIVPAAAHDGNLGANFTQVAGPSWFYRVAVATSPGNTYYGYTRTATPGGRMYFGVGADATGTVSAVAAPNTNSLILQNNANYGFADLASVPFTYTGNTWYRLGVEWTNTNQIRAMLWDEAGNLLASTPFVASPRGAGGIALRAFNTTNADWHFDSVVPEPASLAMLLAGSLALLRRR